MQSLPMGLGDERKVATTQLPRGDRVVFCTDGFTESRAAVGRVSGAEMFANFLVGSTIVAVPARETVLRLTPRAVEHVGGSLRDDAIVFLVDYSG